MHMHALNIPWIPPMHSNLYVWQFCLPLQLVHILYLVLDAFTNTLSFSDPFFMILLYFNFLHQFVTLQVEYFTGHIYSACVGKYWIPISKDDWVFVYLIWPPSLLTKSLTTSLPGARVIIINTFLHQVLNFFHDFLRIMSNVNFINGRIGEVIVSPPALVQEYPGSPFNHNFQALNN